MGWSERRADKKRKKAEAMLPELTAPRIEAGV
jgi:hypothetical protein